VTAAPRLAEEEVGAFYASGRRWEEFQKRYWKKLEEKKGGRSAAEPER
jgi:hypothetical protein